MVTKVRKWGKGLGIQIPMSLAAEAGLEMGASVSVLVERRGLVIRLVRRKRLDLAYLLKRVHARNLHGRFDEGAAFERESW